MILQRDDLVAIHIATILGILNIVTKLYQIRNYINSIATSRYHDKISCSILNQYKIYKNLQVVHTNIKQKESNGKSI